MRRPAAAWKRLGWDARGSSDRPRRLGRKALPTCEKAAVKGRWAGVPIDPAAYGSPTSGFALRNLHKSLGRAGWCLAVPAAGARVAPAFGLRRLVQVSCGWPQVGSAPTCGRPRVHELRASVAVAARMDVFSTKRGKNFNLCGTPQNMTLRRIIPDLRLLRNACAGRAANGRRRHRTRQEFQLVVPQVEILASLREKNRHAGARGRRTPRRRTGNGVRTAGARDGKACDAPAAAAPIREQARFGAGGNAFGLRKPRRSRVDEQLCSSTLPPMVRQPAGSPYETSTNRRGVRAGGALCCGGRSGCGHTSPAAIGAGFVRLASGRRARPTCGRPRVHELRTSGTAPSAAALQQQSARGAWTSPRASGCTFFEVRCSEGRPGGMRRAPAEEGRAAKAQVRASMSC